MTAQCDDPTEERETSLFISTHFHDVCLAAFACVSPLDGYRTGFKILKDESGHMKHLGHSDAVCLQVSVYI